MIFHENLSKIDEKMMDFYVFPMFTGMDLIHPPKFCAHFSASERATTAALRGAAEARRQAAPGVQHRGEYPGADLIR